MFAFFTRSARKPRSSSDKRARLSVEPLEARDCPAAPQITLEVTMLTGRMVRLSGTVTDENPATVLVQFSGAAVGNTNGNASGSYSLEIEGLSLGTVFANGTDQENLSSNTPQGNLTSSAPVITDFVAMEEGGGYWAFRGRVIDECPGGLVVRFGGLPSLAGRTATVDSSGWFSLAVQLAPGEEGTATAETTDWWDLDSNVAEALVRQT